MNLGALPINPLAPLPLNPRLDLETCSLNLFPVTRKSETANHNRIFIVSLETRFRRLQKNRYLDQQVLCGVATKARIPRRFLPHKMEVHELLTPEMQGLRINTGTEAVEEG